MLFTLEIDGRAVLVMAEDDPDAAAAAARAPAMTEQLAALDHAGRRLWNGRTPPRLRPATAAEAATWRAAFAEAVADGDAYEDEADSWATFLIDVAPR
jgi:hypothetical protein